MTPTVSEAGNAGPPAGRDARRRGPWHKMARAGLGGRTLAMRAGWWATGLFGACATGNPGVEAKPATKDPAAPAADRKGVKMSDLDLRAYDADVVEHVLMGRARSRLFEKVSDDRAWSVDLGTGSLRIGDQAFAAQILGTWSSASQAFLWAWANPGKAEWGPSLRIADQLHARGAQPGQAVYQEAKTTDAWVPNLELAYVAGELSGGHPVFLARHELGYAVLLVTDAQIDASTISLAYLPGVLLDLRTMSFGHAPACARRFLERLGFGVQDGPNGLRGSRDGHTIDVEFEEGGIRSVSLDGGA